MSSCKDVLDALATYGVLLLQDKSALSIVGIMTGEKLSTSWWSHARGAAIFECLEGLGDDPNVFASRLVAGKVTYVHRRLWPEFLAVARSRQAWQTQGMSREGRRLFDSIDESGIRASGRTARELQDRLLVHAEQIHTEGGRHELHLQHWPDVQKTQLVGPASSIDKSRAAIEAAVLGIGASIASLPWHRFGKTPARKRRSA